MKKQFVLVTVVAALLLGGMAWAQGKYDVRNVRWGMSKEEIKKAESQALLEDRGNMLIYADEIMGKPTQVRYYLENGKLCRVVYSVDTGSTGAALSLYARIGEQLAEQYTEDSHDSERTVWRQFHDKRTYVMLTTGVAEHQGIEILYEDVDTYTKRYEQAQQNGHFSTRSSLSRPYTPQTRSIYRLSREFWNRNPMVLNQ